MAPSGGRRTEEGQSEEGKRRKKRTADTHDGEVCGGVGGGGGGPPPVALARNVEPSSEAQVVCWLASSGMALDQKIEVAVAAMPPGAGLSPQSSVSARLACAVLQFAANALIRSAAAADAGHGTASRGAEPAKRNVWPCGFENEVLWGLVERSLQCAPGQIASTVSGVGGHLVRPMHAALNAVMRHCKAMVAGDDRSETTDATHHAALARSVSAALALLRGPHASSFQPPLSVLCTMLSSLCAELTSILDELAAQISAAARGTESQLATTGVSWPDEGALTAVRCAAGLVKESVGTVSLATGRAPNQRKIFTMVVDDLVGPCSMLFFACSRMQRALEHVPISARSSIGAKLQDAAQEGWRVYRKMEALIGTSLFSEEHLGDFPLAYSFRTTGKGATHGPALPDAAAAERGAEGEGDNGVGKGKGKKMRSEAGSGVYRGEKLRSYQGALFAKLLALAQPPPSSVSKGGGEGSGGGGAQGKRQSTYGADAIEAQAGRQGRAASKERTAVLHWFPELLRLFVVCTRRCANN